MFNSIFPGFEDAKKLEEFMAMVASAKSIVEGYKEGEYNILKFTVGGYGLFSGKKQVYATSSINDAMGCKARLELAANNEHQNPARSNTDDLKAFRNYKIGG